MWIFLVRLQGKFEVDHLGVKGLTCWYRVDSQCQLLIFPSVSHVIATVSHCYFLFPRWLSIHLRLAACHRIYLRWIAHQSTSASGLTRSLPSSKITFFQPFRGKCISEVVRIWGYNNHFSVWVSFEKPSSSYCVMWYYWCRGSRRNNLITFGSEKVNCGFILSLTFILLRMAFAATTLQFDTTKPSPVLFRPICASE